VTSDCTPPRRRIPGPQATPAVRGEVQAPTGEDRQGTQGDPAAPGQDPYQQGFGDPADPSQCPRSRTACSVATPRCGSPFRPEGGPARGAATVPANTPLAPSASAQSMGGSPPKPSPSSCSATSGPTSTAPTRFQSDRTCAEAAADSGSPKPPHPGDQASDTVVAMDSEFSHGGALSPLRTAGRPGPGAWASGAGFLPARAVVGGVQCEVGLAHTHLNLTGAFA
jgi:hypothetical protein